MSEQPKKKRGIKPTSSFRLSWADRIGPAAARVSLSQSSRKRPRSSQSSSDAASSLWVDKYRPKDAAKLCVAPKKVKEVRSWMQDSSSSSSSRRMLVWVGSPGVGKSTTIQVLASELGWTVHEWSDSYSTHFQRNSSLLSVDQTNSLGSFEEFLQQTGAGFAPLALSSSSSSTPPRKSVILIDELPNLHDRQAEERFRAIMSRHLLQSSVPTVLIYSNVQEGKHKPADLEKLIDPHYLYSPAVQILQCHPVTTARLKKALEPICKQEKIRVPPNFWDEVHLQSGGDLRHAIMSLQFRRTDNHARHADDNDKASEHFKRDAKLSTFHALGKVLYSKRQKDADPAKFHGRAPLEFDPDHVLQKSDMGLGGALTFLEYHCPDFFTDVGELSDTFAHYSDAAMFVDRPMDSGYSESVWTDGYASSLAGRAAANFNRHPAPRSFRQFSAPKVFDVMRKRRGNGVTMQHLCKRLSVGSQQIALNANLGDSANFVTNDLPYMRQILPHEVNSALDNLYSFARPDDRKEMGDRSKDEVLRLAEEQRKILEEDDIVDGDSWDDAAPPLSRPSRPPPQSKPEPPTKGLQAASPTSAAAEQPITTRAYPEIIVIDV